MPVSEVSLCLCSVSCDVQCGRRLSFSTQPNCPVFLPEHTLSGIPDSVTSHTHTHTHTPLTHTRAIFKKIFFTIAFEPEMCNTSAAILCAGFIPTHVRKTKTTLTVLLFPNRVVTSHKGDVPQAEM